MGQQLDGVKIDPTQETQIQRFLADYCLECHGASKSEADLSLEGLSVTSVSDRLGVWREVLQRLDDRSMPPKEHARRPEGPQYDSAAQIVRDAVDRALRELEQSQPYVPRRLNRREYANTLRDLLGISWDAQPALPLDDSLNGFDNVADGLQLSTMLLEQYLDSAENAIERAIRIDPKPEVRKWAYSWDPSKQPALQGFNLYNGNNYIKIGERMVYIGGPALFSEIFPYPPNRFQYEGNYRVKIWATPKNFKPGAVATFQVDTANGMIAQKDFAVENDKEILFESGFYYDRSDSVLKVEFNWTNGNHLPWPVRNSGVKDQYYNYWYILNYDMVDGKRIDRKIEKFEDLPFSYFENVTMEFSGPYFDVWPPPSTTALIGNPGEQINVNDVLKQFLPRCFRRPVTPEEHQSFVVLYEKLLSEGNSPIEAIKSTLVAALTSPAFLFMTAPIAKDAPSDQCSQHELASRLSFFLWSSMPDEELLRLADEGKLDSAEQIAKQVDRMLGSPKAQAFLVNFPRQWLRLDRLSSVMPEPKLFPFYNEMLRDAMHRETLSTFREIVEKDLPITDFLASDWTFLNERLADHYEIPGINGDEMRRVSPLPANRGGLVTQAAILTLTSEATRTSPVVRGKWLLDCIFHRPPPPPPPNVSNLTPDASKAKTAREHLLLHRNQPNCAGCHAKIDPYGLVLENFDAIGQWRTEELPWEDPAAAKPQQDSNIPPKPVPVVALTELPDGSVLDSPEALKRFLLEHRDDFALGFTEQLLTYATGRTLRQADYNEARELSKQLATKGYHMRELIRAITLSSSFRMNLQTDQP